MPFGQTRPPRQRAHSAPGRFPGRPARHTPSLLVEVSREKPARFVWQQRMYADGLFTQQMLLDDGVGHREELPCLLGDLLPILQAAPVDRARLRSSRVGRRNKHPLRRSRDFPNFHTVRRRFEFSARQPANSFTVCACCVCDPDGKNGLSHCFKRQDRLQLAQVV
jgi:hypothetical protein